MASSGSMAVTVVMSLRKASRLCGGEANCTATRLPFKSSMPCTAWPLGTTSA